MRRSATIQARSVSDSVLLLIGGGIAIEDFLSWPVERRAKPANGS